MAKQIADEPFGSLGSFDLMFEGIRKVIKAEHQCMTTRGVHKPGVVMKTSRMLGAFRDDPTTRRELLSMIGHD